MKKFYFLLSIFAINFLNLNAQCPAMENAVKEIVSTIIHPTIGQRYYDTFEKVACYTLEGINEDDFILLGKGLEYSDITKNDPNTVEYNVLRMFDRKNGVACEHIFIKRKKNTANYRSFNHSQRQKITNLIKIKEENLALLKKQQDYLNTDVMNTLGDVLVGQIDAPGPFSDIVSDAAQKLKDQGIEQLSKYYEIEYVLSENETANLVRKIIAPIDQALGVFGIPTGKWLKYWEAIKLAPDGGMVIGNVAAKIRIYFMEKELQDDIDNLKKRLAEIPIDAPSNAYSGTSEERIYLKSN